MRRSTSTAYDCNEIVLEAPDSTYTYLGRDAEGSETDARFERHEEAI